MNSNCEKNNPQMNAVEGFNPADFIRTDVGENGEQSLYLDVKYRLLWFRLHRPEGKIESELVSMDMNSACFCCRVYAYQDDPADKYIGKAYAQRFRAEGPFGERFLETAETAAKGRALADAGYGTQFCINGERTEDGIVDAPVHMPPEDSVEQRSKPEKTEKRVAPAQQGVTESRVSMETAAERTGKAAENGEMTLERAKAVKVDFGKYAGKTLGEIAMIEPRDLEWYVKFYSGNKQELKQGAALLLTEAGRIPA